MKDVYVGSGRCFINKTFTDLMKRPDVRMATVDFSDTTAIDGEVDHFKYNDGTVSLLNLGTKETPHYLETSPVYSFVYSEKDTSSNHNTVLRRGLVTYADAKPLQDSTQHIQFPGKTGSFLEIPYAPYMNFKSDFTIEGLFQRSELSDRIEGLLSRCRHDGIMWRGWRICISGDHIFWAEDGEHELLGGTHPSLQELDSNKYIHFAFVRKDNLLSLFIEGKKVGEVKYDYTLTLDFPLLIGSVTEKIAGGYPFSGGMSRIIISKVARYTSDFIPPDTQAKDDMHTLLLLKGNALVKTHTTTVDEMGSKILLVDEPISIPKELFSLDSSKLFLSCNLIRLDRGKFALFSHGDPLSESSFIVSECQFDAYLPNTTTPCCSISYSPIPLNRIVKFELERVDDTIIISMDNKEVARGECKLDFSSVSGSWFGLSRAHYVNHQPLNHISRILVSDFNDINQPEVPDVLCSGLVTQKYLKTSGTNSIVLDEIGIILKAEADMDIPSGTEIRGLLSFNGGKSWNIPYKDTWTPVGQLDFSQAPTMEQLLNSFSNLAVDDILGKIDLAVQLSTSSDRTPLLNAVRILYK